MAAKRRAALGFKVHTGWPAAVAVGAPTATPQVIAKARLQVAWTFDEGAVFHVGQQLPLEQARELIRDAEARFGRKSVPIWLRRNGRRAAPAALNRAGIDPHGAE